MRMFGKRGVELRPRTSNELMELVERAIQFDVMENSPKATGQMINDLLNALCELKEKQRQN